MIGKNEFRNGKSSRGADHTPALDGREFVVEALRFFAGDADEAQRFFGWSGLDAGSLRAAAAEPDFSAGVLDYFAQNLASLERFCEGAGFSPAAVLHLHESLRPRGLTSHDDL